MDLTLLNSAETIRGLTLPDYPGDYFRVPPASFEGRGIVIGAGGVKYIPSAYCLVRLLRAKGCSLPIQIWYSGAKEYDETFVESLSPYNVEFVNTEEVNENSIWKQDAWWGWESKTVALVNCPFKEVIWLDADMYPDGNPEELFDSPEYQESNALFFPDIRKVQKDANYWQAFGLDYDKYQDEWEWESGVIYVNKEVHWKPLLLASWLCSHSSFYMNNQISHGDKDLFSAAWRILGAKYWSPVACHAIPMCLVQLDTHGVWYFYHRILQKFDLGRRVTIDGFANEELLHGFLDELGKVWKAELRGIVLSDEEREATSALAGSKWTYHRVGIDKREMVFGDGVITEGAAGAERAFYVRDGKLHLVGDVGVIAVLQLVDGAWVGRWVGYERCVVVLEERV